MGDTPAGSTRSRKNYTPGTTKRAAAGKRGREEEDSTTTKAKKRMAGDEDEDNRPISAQLAEMKRFLGKKIDEGHNKLDANMSALTMRIDKNENAAALHKQSTDKAIDLLKASVNEIKSKLSDNLGIAPGTAASYAETAGRAAVPVRPPRHDQTANQYWNSRQSARISPIEGAGEEEMWASLQRFFFEKMRIPRTDLNQTDILQVRRVLTARGRKSKLEVSVKFVDLETRDRIGSYARNLGEYIENGKATATFRLDVPSHLTGVHRTLMQYGYDLNKKHGHGFKRNIRPDDTSMSYCIDVLIPGQNNGRWSTVSYDQAYADRQIAKEDGPLDGALSTQKNPEQSGEDKTQDDVQAAAPAAAGAAAATAPGSTGDFTTWGRRG